MPFLQAGPRVWLRSRGATFWTPRRLPDPRPHNQPYTCSHALTHTTTQSRNWLATRPQVCYPTQYLAPDLSGPPADADPTQARIGVCAPRAKGILMPSRLPQVFPTPAAYFPLSEVGMTHAI